MKSKLSASCILLVLTSACGGTIVEEYFYETNAPVMAGPALPVGSVASTSAGGFVVTQDANTVALPTSNVTFNGQTTWMGSSGFRAGSYTGTDVLAIGGVDGTGTPFAGITGTLTSAPTGNATYVGRYSVASGFNQTQSELTLSFDLADKTVTNVGGDLTVVADVSGAELAGTVTYNGAEADLSGGFYGTNEVAGAFNGSGLGGVIYGSQTN